MLELVKAGGWPMIPLLLLSAVALAIIVERFWTLRRRAVLPPGLGDEVRAWAARGRLDPTHIESLRQNSPLGALLASALDVRQRPRDQVRERIEDVVLNRREDAAERLLEIAERFNKTEKSDDPAAAETGRKRRPSVPSWDDVMFGAGRPRR
mgnify:CR=1 FL=1